MSAFWAAAPTLPARGSSPVVLANPTRSLGGGGAAPRSLAGTAFHTQPRWREQQAVPGAFRAPGAPAPGFLVALTGSGVAPASYGALVRVPHLDGRGDQPQVVGHDLREAASSLL